MYIFKKATFLFAYIGSFYLQPLFRKGQRPCLTQGRVLSASPGSEITLRPTGRGLHGAGSRSLVPSSSSRNLQAPLLCRCSQGAGPQAPGRAEDGRRLCTDQRSPPVASGAPPSEPLGHLHSAALWPCCMGTAEPSTHVSRHRAQEPLYSWTPKLSEISSMSHFLS